MSSISHLNAYFALIVSFAPKYQKDAGGGTDAALRCHAFVAWTTLLALWEVLGLSW